MTRNKHTTYVHLENH